jgi:hypothetical protein
VGDDDRPFGLRVSGGCPPSSGCLSAAASSAGVGHGSPRFAGPCVMYFLRRLRGVDYRDRTVNCGLLETSCESGRPS